MIVLLSQIAPELRYCEWLATRLECNYKHLSGDIRSMVMAGWLYSERGQVKNRRKYLSINQIGLVEAAKEFLSKNEGVTDGT